MSTNTITLEQWTAAVNAATTAELTATTVKKSSNPYLARFNKEGNRKIGILWSFAKLAGNGIINGCKGTCGNHCSGCYNAEDPQNSPCYVFSAYRMYGWEHSSIVKGHIRNTEVVRADLKRTYRDLNNQIKRAHKLPAAIRYLESGELESAEELKMVIKLANNNPGVKFYMYTKNYDVVDKVMHQMQVNKKKMLPDNLWINISIWHENGIECYQKWKGCKGIRAFIYDDGFDYDALGLQIQGKCAAYRKEGNKVILDHNISCDICGKCFSNKCKAITCLDH